MNPDPGDDPRPRGALPVRAAGNRILMIFVDGVGVGEADPARNPFARAVLPTLQELLGGKLPTLDRPTVRARDAVALGLDATLGVPGTPQSGTGQTALLTGENAPARHGSHFGPWVPVRLRPLVEERSVLRRARDGGLRVAFANAYPRGWPGPRGGKRLAGPPLAARGAGALIRHEEALAGGRAVASEIVNDRWRRRPGHSTLPDVGDAEAGRILARISHEADLTLFAHYDTDDVGHEGGMPEAVAALERVDRFLGGVRSRLDGRCTWIVTTDHGNLEDVTAQHTTNPALFLAAGPDAHRVADGIGRLTDVTGAILRTLGVEA